MHVIRRVFKIIKITIKTVMIFYLNNIIYYKQSIEIVVEKMFNKNNRLRIDLC